MQIFYKKREGGPWGMLILLILSLTSLIPLGWAVLSSFKNTSEIFAGTSLLPEVWRWKNYRDAWVMGHIGRNFLNSAIVTASVTILVVSFSSIAGYAFAKLRLKNHPWIFYIYLIGLAVPVQATILSISLQLKDMSLHNSLLGLILALTGTGMPFAVFLMRNFFRDITDSFAESARIDGASEWTILIRIYLPLARAGVLALMVFVIITTWNEFILSLMVLTDDKLWTIPLAVSSFSSHTINRYGLVFASSVISFIPAVLAYLFFQRSFIEGITAGGVKG